MKRVFKAVITFALTICLPVAALAVPAEWPKKLTIGLIPTESSSHITERFDNLHKYLEKKLGIPVELKTSTDYAGVITAMQFKHIDMGYFGPK